MWCGGTGRNEHDNACEFCNGSGDVDEFEDDEDQITYPGDEGEDDEDWANRS
jgi:hypothetical protein